MIQEIENTELAQDRVKDYYELKGYLLIGLKRGSGA